MKTKIGGKELIEEAAKLIKEGEVVAFPTETVYGLGADAFNKDAVEKIFKAKGRPADNPLIVHLSSKDQLNKVAIDIPKEAYILIDAFSPGPLTLILNRHPDIPNITTSGLNTVGIRFPNNKLAQMLISKSDTPIAAPSANISGRLSPTTGQAVYEDMNGKIPMILDDGKCQVGIESTVLDLTKKPYTILRPGAISAKMLAPYLSDVKNFEGEVKIVTAPGMKYKHYAPLCPCVGVKKAKNAINHYDKVLDTITDKVVIIGNDFFLNLIPDKYNKISIGKTPTECMALFFDTMREAEKKYKYIILQNFEDYPEFYSLNNRIEKSTAHIIV
ncbi:MAG TPA: threonylcarbamoyl-AMP synthase [Clostridiales bacterium]|nr:threonylcarbamoyl-AMP synthase [Clostridiales bacterium]